MAKLASPIWGGVPYDITQSFGPGYRPDWYQYSATLGAPAGYHVALDVGVPKGTPIHALNAGRVIQAGPSDDFRPEPVWVQTTSGAVEIYGHLWTDAVRPGDIVMPGTLLGYSGEQTQPGTKIPDGSGPHLHFELRVPDSSTQSGYRAIDPTAYVQRSGGTTGGVPGQMAYAIDTGDIAGDIAGAIFDWSGLDTLLQDWAPRVLFVALGLLLLGFGLVAVLRDEPVQDTVKATRRGATKVAKTAATRGKARG